ncbi:unnamed protein product [Dicrocoelium dendriticum]|nr:unnamed protein product [Dicrocoelium dendriticum]
MASPTLKSTSGALSPLRSSTIAMDFSSADPAISPSTTFTGQRNFLDKIVNKDTSAESNAKFDLTTNYHSDRPCICQQSSMGPDCYCSSTASTLKASSLKRRAIAALRVHFDQNHATLEPQEIQEPIEIAEKFKQTIQKEWDVLSAQVTKCMCWLTSKAQSVHSGYAKVYNCARKDLVDYQWEVTRSVNKMYQFLEKNFIAVLSDCLRSTQHIIHRTCAPAHPVSSSFVRVDQGFSAACRRCGVLNQCR